MPSFPPLLSTGTAFVRQGIARIYIVPTIANIASPTRAELTAGTDVTQNCTNMTTWIPNQNFANRAVMGSQVVGTIAGTANFPTQTLSFEAGANSVDIRSLLSWTPGQQPSTKFIVFLNEGDIAGQLMDVFKVTVGVVGSQRVMGDTEAQIDVAFGVNDNRMGVAIPANP